MSGSRDIRLWPWYEHHDPGRVLNEMILHGQDALPVVDEADVLIGAFNGFGTPLLGSDIQRW
ncbi:MAG: hypothetical protein E4H25_07340 [Methanomassiliicoccus sp.]|nr:MAG: hypothetical protein E4H25_07340 [Methanomassiliicoccus sp.]